MAKIIASNTTKNTVSQNAGKNKSTTTITITNYYKIYIQPPHFYVLSQSSQISTPSGHSQYIATSEYNTSPNSATYIPSCSHSKSSKFQPKQEKNTSAQNKKTTETIDYQGTSIKKSSAYSIFSIFSSSASPPTPSNSYSN